MNEVQKEADWIKPFNDKSLGLLRGIVKEHILNGENGERITSAAFKGITECSVDRSDMRKKEETLQSNAKFFCVGNITLHNIDNVNDTHPEYLQTVIHDPQINNVAHSLINGNKTASVSKQMALLSTIICKKQV